MKPIFIITIDTEGDNIWACPDPVTTENAAFVPRFQALCEKYGFKPTYLVNYEMAIEPRFQEFGRSVLKKNSGEIGLHVHPWNSPPIAVSKFDPRFHHFYMFEISQDLLSAKISYLTHLLTRVFETTPLSHRAGRWGFDESVASALVEAGYLVDCSVTPGVSWKRRKGAPDGTGGPDYFEFSGEPYFIDLNNVARSGKSQLLEVPVTIKPNYPQTVQALNHLLETTLPARVFRRIVGPSHSWLRPNGRNLNEMLSVIDWAIQRQASVLEFMLHSSELMPGGSPTFKSAEQIDLMYGHLDLLFSRLVTLGIKGQTLAEFRSTYETAPANVTQLGSAVQSLSPVPSLTQF